jgi:hypothetical protein
MSATYIEDFNDGPGGWFGWTNNLQGPKPLTIRDGAAVTSSPWWIDYTLRLAPDICTFLTFC